MSASPKLKEEYKPKRKPEPIYLRVIKGGLVPADQFAEKQLREKRLKVGDVIKSVVLKLRNPKFNRLVHRIGVLCVENIDEFRHMDAHAVLKRLQLEGNICCDEVAIKPAGIGLIPVAVINSLKPVLEMFGLKLNDHGLLIVRVPRSLSFDSMDESEYQDAAKRICRYIAEVYWAGLEPERIERMADSMVME